MKHGSEEDEARAPDDLAVAGSEAAEFLVRRCHYREKEETHDGFYITFYLFGYGEDEPQAQQRWAIALKLVENAIRQISVAS